MDLGFDEEMVSEYQRETIGTFNVQSLSKAGEGHYDQVFQAF